MDIVKAYLLQFLLVYFITTTAARKLTYEELHSFPKFFHLDDFERCLAKRDGLYCLGTFELTASQPHTILDLMKEHTKERYSFNRTLLRRGYCVSERCSTLRSQNDTLRFERCAAKQLRRYSITPHLKKLHYCTTPQQRQEESTRGLNTEQLWFLYVLGLLLLLNVVGTVHHYIGDGNKNAFLMAWSLPTNWASFMKTEQSGMLAVLAPLQATRVILQCAVTFGHTVASHHAVFVQNAEFLETLPIGLVGTVLANCIELVQVFLLMSCFFTGYNLLYTAHTSGISASILLKWIFKRLTRLVPVYFLVLGFVITWWPHAGDGALWSSVVGGQSEVCRRKFWSQLFFINNLVEPSDRCLVQTWAIALDMQLYIISTIVTLLLMKLKIRAVPTLGFLFVASVVVNVTLAYVNGWVAVVMLVTPENIRNLFKNTPVFAKVHLSPWCSMTACFLGLFLAHLYFEKTNKKRKRGPNRKDSGQTDLGVSNKSMQSDPIETVGHNELNNGCSSVSNNGQNENELLQSNGSNQESNKTYEILGEPNRNGSDQNGGSTEPVEENKDEKLSENGIRRRKGWIGKTIEETKAGSEKDGLASNEREGNGPARNGEQKNSGRNENGGDEIDGPNGMNKGDKNGVAQSNGANGVASILKYHLMSNGHICILACLFLWAIVAARIVDVESAAITALYVGVERAVFTVLFTLLLIHLLAVDSFMQRFMAGGWWQPIGRLVYSATLLHWCVNISLVASRSEVIGTSIMFIIVDFLAVIIFSYLLAIPVFLLVELPALKFLNLLISTPSTMVRFIR